MIIVTWFLPFFNTIRLKTERYQLLLAEKIANDINLLFYDPNRLRRYLHNIKIGENGFIYIIDRFGRLVFYSPNFPTINERSLGVAVPVSNAGWQVVVGVPLSEALKEQYAALSIVFLMLLIGLLFVILLLVVMKKLVKVDRHRPFRLLLHKVRTPLTSVKWNLHSLLSGDWGLINDQQRKFLERSYRANQQMIKLADELTDSAVLESSNYHFKLAKEDIITLVAEVVDELGAEAKKANIKIIFNKPQNLPHISIDRGKIKLALKNLLDNAIHYNLSGGRVEVSIVKERGTIVIGFFDTGIGIATDQQAKLFSKFFRTTKAMQIQSTGFGLGLYIAKLIVDGHCGKILVESKEHKGSTFSMVLPI